MSTTTDVALDLTRASIKAHFTNWLNGLDPDHRKKVIETADLVMGDLPRAVEEQLATRDHFYETFEGRGDHLTIFDSSGTKGYRSFETEVGTEGVEFTKDLARLVYMRLIDRGIDADLVVYHHGPDHHHGVVEYLKILITAPFASIMRPR